MYVIPFVQIKPKDIDLVGKKALSLGEMTNAKFPVPEGFVVSAEAFSSFLKESHIIASIKAELGRVQIEEMHSVDYASRVIMDQILAAEIPTKIATEVMQQYKHINSEFTAVRASAFADEHQISWSGELETFLHVDPSKILDHIKDCWASLFSTRSLYYLFQQKKSFEDVKMAVIVQRMIDSKAAGIVYTAHPVTMDKNQMVVEAGFGLGQAIVDGDVMPDTYTVQKKPYEIIDKIIHEQGLVIDVQKEDGTVPHDLQKKQGGEQKLSDKNIERLVKLSLKVEEFYKFPVDVEWALDDSFYILQARKLKAFE